MEPDVLDCSWLIKVVESYGNGVCVTSKYLKLKITVNYLVIGYIVWCHEGRRAHWLLLRVVNPKFEKKKNKNGVLHVLGSQEAAWFAHPSLWMSQLWESLKLFPFIGKPFYKGHWIDDCTTSTVNLLYKGFLACNSRLFLQKKQTNKQTNKKKTKRKGVMKDFNIMAVKYTSYLSFSSWIIKERIAIWTKWHIVTGHPEVTSFLLAFCGNTVNTRCFSCDVWKRKRHIND